MTRIRWRWQEKDFGFRFRTGRGKTSVEHYQAAVAGEFYVVPARERKFLKVQMEALAENAVTPTAPEIVPNPWRNYNRDWDWIESEDGICINFAGCLHRDEIERREDEGVARSLALVATLAQQSEPSPLTVALIRQIHIELSGDIYPFAGQWRTVDLHKGDGPTKWPLPPGGIDPLMEAFERDALSRSPFLSDQNILVYKYVSEVMNELLAIHPFREGNGRTAFILGNLILMQNGLPSLNVYDPRRHEAAYYAACEAGRIEKNYQPLTALIETWAGDALARWEDADGLK